VYAFLIVAALFFLLPLYVMIVTSVKPMEEIRQGRHLRAAGARHAGTLAPGLEHRLHRRRMRGMRTGFWNSVAIACRAPSCRS
jgi:glucose/mannose transport system permease protein